MHFASFGVDVGIDQLLSPLLAGATVVMHADESWEPARFSEAVKEQRLTAVHLSPHFWQQWVEFMCQERDRSF